MLLLLKSNKISSFWNLSPSLWCGCLFVIVNEYFHLSCIRILSDVSVLVITGMSKTAVSLWVMWVFHGFWIWRRFFPLTCMFLGLDSVGALLFTTFSFVGSRSPEFSPWSYQGCWHFIFSEVESWVSGGERSWIFITLGSHCLFMNFQGPSHPHWHYHLR